MGPLVLNLQQDQLGRGLTIGLPRRYNVVKGRGTSGLWCGTQVGT
jgi:hypothetical protein